jgi:hypothetical protein
MTRSWATAALCAAALTAQRPASSPTSRPAADDEASRPYPTLVTAATRKDPAALKALETPGKRLCEEGFESADALRRFFEVRGKDDGRATIDADPRAARAGRGALRLKSPAADGKSSGAGATAWLGDEGFERVHLRYYLRFSADYDQGDLNHTGGSLAGVAGTNKWAGMGGAGLRPKGDDGFSSRFEAWKDWGRVASPGYLFLYTYWMDMKRDKDGRYWGNLLGPEPSERFVPARDRWVCYELMLKTNAVGKADGEAAAWIDGKLYEHYRGFRWRSADAVRLKRFDLGVYVHRAVRDNVVWFDDVVVSTGYVGP